MRAFLALLRREIAERRLLLAGAALAGLVPLVLPWFPGPAGLSPADLRGGAALGLAAVAVSLLALGLGSTVLAADLSEGRLGFYFARPLPGWAIWAAKMLGALLLTAGSGALILLPSVLAGGTFEVSVFWAGSALLGIPVLLVVSHAVSVMIRSRSLWLALDVGALGLIGGVLWVSCRVLWREGAQMLVVWSGFGFAACLLVAAAAAGLVQVVRGRTDLRRGHRLLSLTLWALLGGMTLGHLAFVAWVFRVAPTDLISLLSVEPAPAGGWIALQAPARWRGGYTPVFLFNVDSGRFLRLPTQGEGYWWSFPDFSADGRRAVWLERLESRTYRVLALDLSGPEAEMRGTGVYFSESPSSLELSPDGRRLAALTGNRLTVDDLVTGRLLYSGEMPGERGPGERLLFLGPHRLRLFASVWTDEPGVPNVWRLTTLDLEIPQRRLVPVSRIELPRQSGICLLSPEGRWAVLHEWSSRDFQLADLESGQAIPLRTSSDPLALLADGRVLLLHREGRRRLVGLLGPDGAETLRVQIPGSRLQVGGFVAPGQDLLVVSTTDRETPGDDRDWTSWLVDLRTGSRRLIGRGMVQATGFPFPRGSLPAFHRILLRRGGELFDADPTNGHLRRVLTLKSPARTTD